MNHRPYFVLHICAVQGIKTYDKIRAGEMIYGRFVKGLR